MPGALDLFPARVAFVDLRTGMLTPAAIRALQTVFQRVGGATGASTTDLASADDDDSGLEEFKHETGKALQALALAPLAQAQMQIEQLQTEINGLREQVAELVKHAQGIEQGVIYGGNS